MSPDPFLVFHRQHLSRYLEGDFFEWIPDLGIIINKAVFQATSLALGPEELIHSQDYFRRRHG
jgi:hypothetical protein